MLSALVLMAAFAQELPTSPSPLAVKVVEAIDRNYLYADGAAWVRLRPDLLSDGDATVSSLGRKLASLQDGDLRIISREQMSVLQAETAGRERGIGLVDFAVTVEPNTGDPKVVTPLVDSPAFKAGLQPGDVIVSVDERTTHNLMHEEIMTMLRGDSGQSWPLREE